MPRYDYICQAEQRIFEVVQSFSDDSLTKCECGGDVFKYYGNINFSPSAMPTRNSDVALRNSHEKQLEKDLPAYARLRSEGMQPKSTVGAAEIESRANSRYEVESGTIVDKYLSKRVDETKTQLQATGVL